MKQEQLHNDLMSMLTQIDEQPIQAQLLAEKAILWASRNGWIKTLALANLVAGKANIQQQSYDIAVESLQRANTLFKDEGDFDRVAEGYYALASVYLRKGEYSQAIEQLRKSLSWLNRMEQQSELVFLVRLLLGQALMNLGYWSDAEQELLSIQSMLDVSDERLAQYQLLVLRLIFYRGDQRAVREQLQLCRELVASLESETNRLILDYYSARYACKYGKVRAGEKELRSLWQGSDKSNSMVLYLCYEAALDLLRSDYPQKGIYWLSALLDEEHIPLSLKQQVHYSLASFFVSHLSHELASEHFQAAAKLTNSIRDSEINQQWARYQADEMFHELRNQLAQHKKNNQILAQSNALLQAVNRIALAVNASVDEHSLLQRLREQLSGWVDADMVGIAELSEESLHFGAIIEDNRVFQGATIPMSEERAWSVQSVKQGRILYDNDFVISDEILIEEFGSPVRSVAFVPLKWENRVIGVLTLQSRQSDMFDTRSVSLLEYISPVIGIAYANQISKRHTAELKGQVSQQKQELKDVRQLMAHMADHDDLTGLPNRMSLPGHFEYWMLRAPFHCLLLQIANLEEINAALGLSQEADIIRIVSQRLENRVRPEDLLVRVDRDQFMLMVNGMDSAEHLKELAQQLLELSEQPLRAKQQPPAIRLAIGIATYPEHGETIDEIMSMLTVAVAHAQEDKSSVFIIE